MEATDKVIALEEKRRPKSSFRLYSSYSARGRELVIREATSLDVEPIQELYQEIYRGRYGVDFAENPALLRAQIQNGDRYLWLVAQEKATERLTGVISFQFDRINRLGKAAGVAVAQGYRGRGVASRLLQLGIRYLTEENQAVDVIYATTRTVSEAPSRVVGDVGFRQLGLFPNAVQTETLEHLNLDIYLTKAGKKARRPHPYLFPPFQEVYQIARQELKLDKATVVKERAPLRLSPTKIALELVADEQVAKERFAQLSNERRISNSFFPFHSPNRILRSEDGGTEVFVWLAGPGKQAAILGYRTDHVNTHDVLDSVAVALQREGAAYVELLVDAYNYSLQQEAYTARFIPSGYFPAMKLNSDGHRDDFFVLSRTFRLLDFTASVVQGTSLKFLRAYLRHYHDLYLKPLLDPGPRNWGEK